MQLNLNSTQTMLTDFIVKKMATLKMLIFYQCSPTAAASLQGTSQNCGQNRACWDVHEPPWFH